MAVGMAAITLGYVVWKLWRTNSGFEMAIFQSLTSQGLDGPGPWWRSAILLLVKRRVEQRCAPQTDRLLGKLGREPRLWSTLCRPSWIWAKSTEIRRYPNEYWWKDWGSARRAVTNSREQGPHLARFGQWSQDNPKPVQLLSQLCLGIARIFFQRVVQWAFYDEEQQDGQVST